MGCFCRQAGPGVSSEGFFPTCVARVRPNSANDLHLTNTDISTTQGFQLLAELDKLQCGVWGEEISWFVQ